MATEALLWVDLETTGSNENKDCIIEVGAILTTPDLERKEGFTYFVEPTPLGLGRLLQNPVVREMHEKNGLLDDILTCRGAGLPVHEVDKDIVRILEGVWGYNPKTVMLAGSGVGHFDRRFIKAQMPRLNNFLAYAVIDVGVMRRMFQLWGGENLVGEAFNESKNHRALADINLHLKEAQEYRRIIKAVTS